MNRLLNLLALALCATVAMPSAAAPFPDRPIRLIVPTPAGGPSDVAARTLAQALSASLGQSVVVDNRAGAGGAIAAQALLGAPPDGYTLLWGIASLTGLPFLQKTPPFRSLSELTPVSLVGRFPFALFVHPDVPAKTVSEFVAYARAHPDSLSYATVTLGEYMAAEQFCKAAGISALRVPYKGGAQLMPDLISGRVQVNFGPVSSGLQHVNAGKLRMLAVLSAQRSALAPEVPTLAESGYASPMPPSWQALFAPPRTAHDVVARLTLAVAEALRDPALRTRLEEQALQVEGSSPEVLAREIVDSTALWQAFVRDNNIPLE